ncbi:MAG: YggT family protein [Candidatus Omnitrophica bacterium]|nr:YggT family protein [Candidatus Omnitrophota bacterium]
MFVLGNLISAIAVILGYPSNPIVSFIYGVTEPFLAPFRKIVPSYKIGIDLSPIFALLLIWFLKLFIVNTLFGIAARL